ncbi:P pilus assembly/Cpx signaling pathway, periplasmic inhibitor/zinc-resistance associated protein [Cyanosarcina cf. burmensis CCALA 770]|nr:P pilus assembly/Cpx signaling pathway, periplasmic inhibitor/zinc-resistance associated protein [Cyanosarcina cf. burmensis CCALA 770]
MQIKLIPLLASAIALSIATVPLAAQAEPVAPGLQIAQAQDKIPPRLEKLGLTQEQRDKIAEIRRNTRTQIEAVMTPAQREQLKTVRESRQRRREALASLNLTPEQKTKMQQIRQSAKSQFDAVLTPQQQQQLQQMRQERGWKGQRGDR